MAFPNLAGRPKGTKNKLSVKLLVGLQTPEAIKKQWDALNKVIDTGKPADVVNAVKLIWQYTFHNEDYPTLEEDVFDIKEAVNKLSEFVNSDAAKETLGIK